MKENWKKQFLIIYLGQAFSLLGSAAVSFAVIWWLTIQTESAITLTVASIVSFLPNMLIGPFAGVWIDRYNRRTVMIVADGVVAISSVILGVAFVLMTTPPVWFIYLVLFLRGVGNTFHAPAMQAAIPTLVPNEMLTKVGGWGNLVTSISTMLGPVLGATLMGFISISAIMLVDIFGAIFAIVCLLFVKIPDISQTAEKPDFKLDFNQGIIAMRKNKPLMAAMLPLLLATIIYMPLGALFPLLVRIHFMGEAWHNSVVELMFSLGLMVSSLIMGVWGGMRRRFLMISLAIGLLGVTTFISGVLPKEGFWFFVLCCFLMGGSGTFYNVPLMAYIQESTPPEMMGKVFSLLMTVMTVATPIGLLVAGPVTEFAGVDKWFLWSGVAMVVTAILCRLMTFKYDEETILPEKTEK
ncbi:MFS transporter [Peptostreptococcaceae bacterium OttesenSCG-928-C18]|nr:MFS transporter [Peptostreptococcaceae bacterium OttesenSCG-928-C18]